MSARAQMPILSGILLKAEDGFLTASATDFEVGAELFVPANVMVEGAVVVPGRIFDAAIRALPDEEVTISLNRKDKMVSISAGGAKFSLLSMDATEFPDICVSSDAQKILASGEMLKNLISKTAFACGTDSSFTAISGVLLEVGGGKITMVGTNGHRLAKCGDTLVSDTKFSGIIPKRIMSELLRSLPDGEVDIRASNSEIGFSFEGGCFVSRLIAGKFPNYKKVTDLTFSKKAVVDSTAFAGALSRVGLIARSNEYSTVDLSFEQGKVTLFSFSPTVGKAVEDIEATFEGDPIKIRFNVSFLLDVLNVTSKGAITIELNEPLKPVAIRSEDKDFVYVVTPIRAART